MSIFTRELGDVARTVGTLGLEIAHAQNALNAAYLGGLERLLGALHGIAKGQHGAAGAAGAGAAGAGAAQAPKFANIDPELLKEITRALAPTRYQYTETTLTVHMDLAQSLQVGVAASVGVPLGGVIVNAGLTLGFGYDYRAAAEIRTVIHAAPASETVFQPLLDRAKATAETAIELPEGMDKSEFALLEKAVALHDKTATATAKALKDAIEAKKTKPGAA
jgi:hypothetical protein